MAAATQLSPSCPVCIMVELDSKPRAYLICQYFQEQNAMKCKTKKNTKKIYVQRLFPQITVLLYVFLQRFPRCF